jgi:hypothetical protein
MLPRQAAAKSVARSRPETYACSMPSAARTSHLATAADLMALDEAIELQVGVLFGDDPDDT